MSTKAVCGIEAINTIYVRNNERSPEATKTHKFTIEKLKDICTVVGSNINLKISDGTIRVVAFQILPDGKFLMKNGNPTTIPGNTESVLNWVQEHYDWIEEHQAQYPTIADCSNLARAHFATQSKAGGVKV